MEPGDTDLFRKPMARPLLRHRSEGAHANTAPIVSFPVTGYTAKRQQVQGHSLSEPPPQFPRSAYKMFMDLERGRLFAELVAQGRGEPLDMPFELATKWNGMDHWEKQVYRDLSELDHLRHAEEYETWRERTRITIQPNSLEPRPLHPNLAHTDKTHHDSSHGQGNDSLLIPGVSETLARARRLMELQNSVRRHESSPMSIQSESGWSGFGQSHDTKFLE